MHCPRTTIRALGLVALAAAVAALALGAATVTTAEAHPCCNGSLQWWHLHTFSYRFWNAVDSPTLNAETNDARADWRDSTILGLPNLSSHNKPRIHVSDNNFGNTGWVGQAWPCFHCAHQAGSYGHVYLNKYYSQTANQWQGTACQEIGHIIGLDHHSGDCMGLSYFPDTSNRVGQHSADDINNYYPHPPDGSPPHVRVGLSADKESPFYDLAGDAQP